MASLASAKDATGQVPYVYGGVMKQLTNFILDPSPGLYVVGASTIAPAAVDDQAPFPLPRQRASLVHDEKSNVLVMFAGSGTDFAVQQEVFYNDVWISDGRAWKEVQIPSDARPNPRRAHSAVAFERRMIMFGGRDGVDGGTLKDTWILDFDTFQWFVARASIRNDD